VPGGLLRLILIHDDGKLAEAAVRTIFIYRLPMDDRRAVICAARGQKTGERAVKKRGREKKEGFNQVDVFVGQRLRELRMLAGLSQSDVASALGLTFQQLQKYERGFNRVSASRLFKLAQFFRVPVSVFFEGLDERRSAAEGAGDQPRREEAESTLRSREALMLARYFQNIRDPQIRAAIRTLAETCAAETCAAESAAGPLAPAVGAGAEAVPPGGPAIPAARGRRPRASTANQPEAGQG
jgi:transcriptional regulator with XRE-family HTH domain